MRSVLVVLLTVIVASVVNGDCEGPDSDPPCVWRGQAPVCMGECEKEEHKIKEAATAIEAVPYQDTFGKECWYGKKFYCCKKNETMTDADLNRVETRFSVKN